MKFLPRFLMMGDYEMGLLLVLRVLLYFSYNFRGFFR